MNKILILGSNGQLGRAFTAKLSKLQKQFIAPPENEFNITDFASIKSAIESVKPSVIINCAAYNAVDDAEVTPEPAFHINQKAVENLAEICQKQNIFLVHYSTDYVYDGKKGNIYVESDTPNPLGNYGKSKFAGEQSIQNILNEYLIFRTSWVFGDGRQNFIFKFRSWTEKNEILKVSADEVSIPTFTEDIVDGTLKAIEERISGMYHLTNSGYASRYEWGREIAEILKLKNIIIPVPMSSFQTKAERPGFSPMSNEKISKELGITIPDWKDAVRRFLMK